MKNVKVKTFESLNAKALEIQINDFINEKIEDCDVIDIKLHIDPQVDPKWEGVTPMYFAMILYI